MTGFEFPGWRLTVPTWRDGELPPFLLTILFVFCAAQSRVIPAIWRFQVQPRTAATLLSSPVLLKHSDSLALGVALAKQNIAMANRCNAFVFRPSANSTLAVHHVCGPAGNAGIECADCAASVGLRGFVSHDNIPSPGPDSRLLLHPLLGVSQCLSRVVEVLHNLVVVMQLELPSILSNDVSYVLSVGPLVPYFQRRFKPFQPSRCQNV